MSQPNDPYNQQPGSSGTDGVEPTRAYGQTGDYGGGHYGAQPGAYGQNDPYGQGEQQPGAQPNPYGGQADPYGGQADPYGGQADPYGGQADPYGTGQAGSGAPEYAQAGAYGADGGYGGGQPPYGSGPYAASPYGSGPQGPGGSSEKNGLGLTAMILGLAGILVWLAGTVGLILGIIGLKNVKNGVANNRGQALTGVIAGAITTVLGALGTIALVISLVALGGAVSKAESRCNNMEGREWKDNSCKYVGSGEQSDDDDYSQEDQQGDSDAGDDGDADDQQGDAAADGQDDQQGDSDAGADEGDSSQEVASGEPAQLAKGVTVGMTAKSAKSDDTASPKKARNKEIALVHVTVRNRTDESYKPSYPLGGATYEGGKEAVQVFTFIGSKNVEGTLGFSKQVAAKQSRSFDIAYLVPKSQLKTMQIKYDFRLSSGSHKKLTFNFK